MVKTNPSFSKKKKRKKKDVLSNLLESFVAVSKSKERKTKWHRLFGLSKGVWQIPLQNVITGNEEERRISDRKVIKEKGTLHTKALALALLLSTSCYQVSHPAGPDPHLSAHPPTRSLWGVWSHAEEGDLWRRTPAEESAIKTVKFKAWISIWHGGFHAIWKWKYFLKKRVLSKKRKKTLKKCSVFQLWHVIRIKVHTCVSYTPSPPATPG